jgi:hypothetical protein
LSQGAIVSTSLTQNSTIPRPEKARGFVACETEAGMGWCCRWSLRHANANQTNPSKNVAGLDVSHHRRGGEEFFFLDILFHRMTYKIRWLPKS